MLKWLESLSVFSKPVANHHPFHLQHQQDINYLHQLPAAISVQNAPSNLPITCDIKIENRNLLTVPKLGEITINWVPSFFACGLFALKIWIHHCEFGLSKFEFFFCWMLMVYLFASVWLIMSCDFVGVVMVIFLSCGHFFLFCFVMQVFVFNLNW